ncbi:ferrous iron transporter B, partial [Listeria innocua]|nr:ferrous iron transporter B [Listeria innocua]
PILPVVARSGKGTEDILSTLSEKHVAPAIPLVLQYGEPAEKAIKEIQTLTKELIPAKQSRWLAIQFLSKNEVTEAFLASNSAFEQLQQIRAELESELNGKLENHFHQVRVSYIHDICLTSVEYTRNSDIPLSDKLDKIFTHKLLGIPIFLGIMWLIFQITFTWVGAPLSDMLDGFIGGSLTD